MLSVHKARPDLLDVKQQNSKKRGDFHTKTSERVEGLGRDPYQIHWSTDATQTDIQAKARIHFAHTPYPRGIAI